MSCAWSHPHHYAPMISDMTGLAHIHVMMSAPRSRMAAFQCSRRSLMSWFTRASRPMLRIFCVVLMLLRGLVGSHLGPPALTPGPFSVPSQNSSCCSFHFTVLPIEVHTLHSR